MRSPAKGSEEPDSDRSRTTLFLRAAARGEPGAAEQLFPLVYDELRRLAGSALAGERADHTLQPTALVHEAFLRLVDADGLEWRGEARFLSLASRAMRRVLVDHARTKGRAKRGGGWQQVDVEPAADLSRGGALDFVELDGALEELAARSERQARVVELRFFGGLPVEKVARVLEVSESTVEREWRVARAFLSASLGGAGPVVEGGGA